jgi:hypothetical protein
MAPIVRQLALLCFQVKQADNPQNFLNKKMRFVRPGAVVQVVEHMPSK